MKSSFILHLDSLCILDKLTDEQAGKLFKAMYQYQQTKELPELDMLLDMAITPFINQFIRDDQRYEETSEERRSAGSLGGKKRAENAKKQKGLSERQGDASKLSKCLNSKQSQANKANQADSDNDSGSGSDNGNGNGSKVGEVPLAERVENVEAFLLQNQGHFKKIVTDANRHELLARESLRKYHLHLEENNSYPLSIKQALAGFEKWLRNEKTKAGDAGGITTNLNTFDKQKWKRDEERTRRLDSGY